MQNIQTYVYSTCIHNKLLHSTALKVYIFVSFMYTSVYSYISLFDEEPDLEE